MHTALTVVEPVISEVSSGHPDWKVKGRDLGHLPSCLPGKRKYHISFVPSGSDRHSPGVVLGVCIESDDRRRADEAESVRDNVGTLGDVLVRESK